MLDTTLTQLLAAGGGGAAIAFGLFRWLGGRWLEAQFSERLEHYKRLQAEELERTKAHVNLLLHRVTKIHEKEFEVLPRAWEYLQNLIGHVGALVTPFFERPDFERYSSQELEQYLSQSRFLETDRQRLREAGDKAAVYQELTFWYRHREAKVASATLHNYLILNRIFLSADLAELFCQCDATLTNSLISLEVAEAAKVAASGSSAELHLQATNEFLAKDAFVSKIEAEVQERLRFHLAGEA